MVPRVVCGVILAALSGSSGRRGGERGVSGVVLGLIGKGSGHGQLDAAHASAHQRPDLQELEADGTARGAGELGVLEADAAQGADQDVGHRGEPQPQLVGAYRRAEVRSA